MIVKSMETKELFTSQDFKGLIIYNGIETDGGYHKAGYKEGEISEVPFLQWIYKIYKADSLKEAENLWLSRI